MIAVTAHPGGDIRFHIRVEEAGVVIGGLGLLPHVEGFVHDEDTQLVADIHQRLCGRVMAGAQAVDAHLLHRQHLTHGSMPIERAAQAAQVMMQAHAVEFDMLAVDEQAAICCDLNLAEANAFADTLLAEVRFQHVVSAFSNLPQVGIGHSHHRNSFVTIHLGARFTNDVVGIQQPVHDGMVFACADQFGFNGNSPFIPLMAGGDIGAIQRDMALWQHMERDVAIDACAGVPAAVRALMTDMYVQHVLPRLQAICQLRIEGRIAIMVGADHFAVQQHIAIHIHAVKAEDDRLGQPGGWHSKHTAIPAVSIFIEIIFLGNEEIMGQVDVYPCRTLCVLKGRIQRELHKLPVIMKQTIHSVQPPMTSQIHVSLIFAKCGVESCRICAKRRKLTLSLCMP